MDVLQGNGPFACRKSVRYNVTDTSYVKPEFKWPNDGYITNSNVKKPVYDEMSMAQWVAGQLHNISEVEDPILVKLMLQQVTLSSCHPMDCSYGIGHFHDLVGGRSPSVVGSDSVLTEQDQEFADCYFEWSSSG